MSAARRIQALLVASALLVAASAPCPPDAAGPVPRAPGHASRAMDHGHAAHEGHGAHAHALGAADREARPALFLARPCPCRCQTESPPAAGSGRLGYALARAELPADWPLLQPAPALTAPHLPPAPPLGGALVPI